MGIEDFLDEGIQIYLLGDYSSAKKWITRANEFADIQLEELPGDELSNNFIFESYLNTNAWRECKDCNNVSGGFEVHDGIFELTYKNDFTKRDKLAIVSYPDLPLYFFDVLKFRLKADKGTLFTLEIVIDGERSRPIEYEEISENWVELSVPIKGITLNEIGLSFSEMESQATPNSYRLSVDWISLK